MLRLLKRLFLRDQRGSVMVEAAVVMPILVFVLLGGVEVARFALLQQKLSRTAASMADLISQMEGLTVNDMDNLYSAAQFVIRPFELTSGVVIVSSVSKTGTDPAVIDWQCFGAGGLVATSDLGASGDNATLPAGFTMDAGESVIFAEVVYDFTPVLFPDVVQTQRVRHRALFRPRFGALSAIDPAVPPVPPSPPACA